MTADPTPEALQQLRLAETRRLIVDRIRRPTGWHRILMPRATSSPIGILVIAALLAWARPHEWLLFLLVLAEMFSLALNLVDTTKRLDAVSALLDKSGVLDGFVETGTAAPLS